MSRLMIHRTQPDRVESILREGLRADMPVNLTDCGDWAQLWYEANPVFLAMPDAPFIAALDGAGVEIQVDATWLPLVADLPSLCDIGGRVEDGLIWWKAGREPPALLPYLDEHGGIEIEHLIDPGTDACRAAIEATGTAACLEDIPPDRISMPCVAAGVSPR